MNEIQQLKMECFHAIKDLMETKSNMDYQTALTEFEENADEDVPVYKMPNINEMINLAETLFQYIIR